MAQYPSDNITYFLSVDTSCFDSLGVFRHWENLKLAIEDNLIWIKGFTENQISSLAVQSLPHKQLYYSQNNKLFPKSSLLPARSIPSLLWTPIARGIPIELPTNNNIYYGELEKVRMVLIPSPSIEEAFAIVVKLEILAKYIPTAPKIRLKNLSWTILNEKYAFIIGRPIPPVPGEVYWQKSDFLLPVGYDFELYSLIHHYNDLLNSNGNNWIIWNHNDQYFLLDKSDIERLSISSFRKSVKVKSDG